ncbi:hypothetical protein [Candidatus Nucleicultrix amoebiphila]|uniref:Uncharacterized protein n=1 Tax=Candidatus Nucleicultrix amoebiphila FS5 TaxID=1414854 RepID=A0A1W6N3L9_9PROT|nr:hypothetical protein [Candidatus Nucleicultrix amoebiphila]ARN84379.1 hypothetical protein GQ61_02475 [Candidatus Nucleicultrix amoebiphila FS5]
MKDRSKFKVITSSPSRTTIELDDLDAAIILKVDGTLKASLPEVKTETVPENIITAAALVYALNDEELCNLIRKRFVEKCLPQKKEK